MYEAYRWSHDRHQEHHSIIPDALTNDIGSGSFAYDVNANGTRMVHEGFTMASRHCGVKCISECVPKASRDFLILCKNHVCVMFALIDCECHFIFKFNLTSLSRLFQLI